MAHASLSEGAFVQGQDVGLEGLPGQEYALTMKCPEPNCNGNLILKHREDGKPFYGCFCWPHCRGSVGALPNGSPASIPVDSATRKARARVRRLFNRLLEEDSVRQDCPGWLKALLDSGEGLPRVGLLNRSACAEFEARLLADYPEMRSRYDLLQEPDEDF